MLAVLGGLADVERDLIRTRTSEGRVRAIQQGKQMGRPSRLTTAQKREIRVKRQNGITLKSLATTYGLSESAVSRIARSHETPKTTTEIQSDTHCDV
ncbi:DNA resolvase [Acetobacter tropicalis NBRC 101654]|uniref:DNA resolvase n=1 Tax=Acetobacter tropicalis NBRC 101654 TaxID=749388 RepID=F7VJ94_9PROT|nr:DNA resolvase [Acetobacter tropicalis NBRC 101654]